MFDNVDVPYVRTIPVANPAAGSDWLLTGPGQGVWRVVGFSALFTASAAVANRVPTLRLSTSDGTLATAPSGAAITAGLAVTLSSFPGAAPFGVAAGPQLFASPTDGWVLLPGWQLQVVTTAIDVADQWSAIRALVVEYPTGPNRRLTPDVYAINEAAR